MHQRIVFITKKPDVSYENFHLDWNMVHSHLLVPTVNLEGYRQNRPVPAQWGHGRYDGIAELFYETAELEQEAFDSHQSKVIRQHEHSFMVEQATFSALVDEQVELDGPAPRRASCRSLDASRTCLGSWPLGSASCTLTSQSHKAGRVTC